MEQQPRIEEAAIIAAEAELASRHLMDFARGAWHIIEPEMKFVEGWMIRGVAEHLEALARGQIEKNILCNVPPGCCKSTLFSVFFPAWVWTWWPEARFFFASYNQDYVIRDSVRTRQIIRSAWYQERWGYKYSIPHDQDKKELFQNDRGGWRLATSVGGRGTGEHPDFIVVDDAHNVKQAESMAERRSAIDWWGGTMTTRGVTRKAKRAVVMQRLHMEDLSGHILETQADEFIHLCFPMEFEPGRMEDTPLGWNDERTKKDELLWPELFNQTMVDTVKRGLGSLRTAGQFQQRPVPTGGYLFQRENFIVVPAFPEKCRNFVRYWDKAGTEGDGDLSATVLGTEWDGAFYVIDCRWGQWSAGKRKEIIRAVAQQDRERYGSVLTWQEQEPGSGGKESAELTVKDLAGFAIFTERVTGAKWDRAQPVAAQIEARNVLLVSLPARPSSWIPMFLDHVTAFPYGRYDDIIDALSGMFNKLAKLCQPGGISVAAPRAREVEPSRGILLNRQPGTDIKSRFGLPFQR